MLFITVLASFDRRLCLDVLSGLRVVRDSEGIAGAALTCDVRFAPITLFWAPKSSRVPNTPEPCYQSVHGIFRKARALRLVANFRGRSVVTREPYVYRPHDDANVSACDVKCMALEGSDTL